MAPPKQSYISKRQKEGTLKHIFVKYASFEYLNYVIFDPTALPVVSVLILLAELVLNVGIINYVPYTEIDWIAYMQECEGFLNGTRNYALLKGDTGPLVYPAGFVFLYSALYYITAHGQSIRLAQYIFVVIYLLQMWLVLRLYTKSRKVPPYILILTAFTSYRVHSIYVLRLFNDAVAVLFLYAALNLFLDRRWTWGSICFSLGVSIKMNILLFAPALLLFYLTNLGRLGALVQLAVCGVVQLMLGSPFLLRYPAEYLKASFDLGRIFDHKWTVNYRFLTRELFEHKIFHLSLLALHLLLLMVFAKPAFTYFKNYARLRELQQQFEPQLRNRNLELKSEATRPKEANIEEKFSADQQAFLKCFEKGLQKSTGVKVPSQPKEDKEQFSIHFDQCTQLALLPLFLCNFIGLLCARSLHYQFYVWYFHSLPYLAWSTGFSLGLRCLILGLVELCWNTYPSTNFSSALLHVCHLILLFGVGRNMFKTTHQSTTIRAQTENQQVGTTKTTGNKTKTKVH